MFHKLFKRFALYYVLSMSSSTFILWQVLRRFELSPFYVGVIFGLKDGANSIASPVWGYLCDKSRCEIVGILCLWPYCYRHLPATSNVPYFCQLY